MNLQIPKGININKEFKKSILTAPHADANQTHQVVEIFQPKMAKNRKP
jgi:hypothetical protein